MEYPSPAPSPPEIKDSSEAPSATPISRRHFLELLKAFGFLSVTANIIRIVAGFAVENAAGKLPASYNEGFVQDPETGLWGRAPYTVGIQRAGAHADPDSDTLYITDGAGDVIVKSIHVPESRYGRGSHAASLCSEYRERVSGPRSPGVNIVLGDSYLQSISFGLLVTQYHGGSEITLVRGVSGTTPHEYVQSVRRRFDFSRSMNNDIREYLHSHPGAPIVLTYCITPHNDLEGLEPSMGLAEDHTPATTPAHTQLVFDRRGFFKQIAQTLELALGADTEGEKQALRAFGTAVLGRTVTSSSADLAIQPSDPRLLEMKRMIDQVAVEISTQCSGHPIRVELMPWLSFYDDVNITNTWDATLKQVFTHTQRNVAEYTVIDMREIIMRGASLGLYKVDDLFRNLDQHYSAFGKAVVSVASAWARRGETLSQANSATFLEEVNRLRASSRDLTARVAQALST